MGITIVVAAIVECVNDELDSKLVNIGVLDESAVDEPVMQAIYLSIYIRSLYANM